MPALLERPQLQLGRALLPAHDAVAVVQDEDARVRGCVTSAPDAWLTYRADVRARRLRGGPDARPGRLPRGDARLARRSAPVVAVRGDRRRRRLVGRHAGSGRAAPAPRWPGMRARAAPTPRATPASRRPVRRWWRWWTTTCARPAGWLAALLAGARAPRLGRGAGGADPRHRSRGPRRARAGARPPPITTLDLGTEDREARFVWSANMAVRRSALERIGGFDESVPIYGDEEEWLMRLHAAGGRVAYVAAAGPRAPPPGRRRAAALAGAVRVPPRPRRAPQRPPQGHRPRRWRRELRDLAGAGWHTARRRCPQGLVMGAHSAGRLVEALRGRDEVPRAGGQAGRAAGRGRGSGELPDPASFLSGESGGVTGIRLTVTRTARGRGGDLGRAADPDRAEARPPGRLPGAAARARAVGLPPAARALPEAVASCAPTATTCASRSAPPALPAPELEALTTATRRSPGASSRT